MMEVLVAVFFGAAVCTKEMEINGPLAPACSAVAAVVKPVLDKLPPSTPVEWPPAPGTMSD